MLFLFVSYFPHEEGCVPSASFPLLLHTFSCKVAGVDFLHIRQDIAAVSVILKQGVRIHRKADSKKNILFICKLSSVVTRQGR